MTAYVKGDIDYRVDYTISVPEDDLTCVASHFIVGHYTAHILSLGSVAFIIYMFGEQGFGDGGSLLIAFRLFLLPLRPPIQLRIVPL